MPVRQPDGRPRRFGKQIKRRRVKMARRKIVAGNWKMNMTPSEAVKLCGELKDLVKSDDVDVVYCVPAIDIVPVVEAVKGNKMGGGAGEKLFEGEGGVTGGSFASLF